MPPRNRPATRRLPRDERISKIMSMTRVMLAEKGHDNIVMPEPVLGPLDAVAHPHNLARGTYTQVDGVTQPQPAPRFGRTPSALRNTPPAPGADTAQVLADWGFDAGEVARLQRIGAVAAS